jgi:hypothetical protein
MERERWQSLRLRSSIRLCHPTIPSFATGRHISTGLEGCTKSRPHQAAWQFGSWRKANHRSPIYIAFDVMNILYPKIRLAWLPIMLGYAALGAVIAGGYGMLHDQVTYSISPEYFTRLKFPQFRYADFGLQPRLFVAEVGFLATWWVGFFAAWFIARITVPAFPPPKALRYSLRGFLIILTFAFAACMVGYLLGLLHSSDYRAWEDFGSALGVQDLPSFVRVAYIHNASYLGGLVGLIVALIHLRGLRTLHTIAASSRDTPC